LLILAVLCITSASAQTRHPLDGVWSRVGGVSNGRLVSNQPGYRMFVDGYYAWVWVNGMTPRAPAPPTGATPAQIREANRIQAQAGRNEITSMQTHVTRGEDRVTLNPAGMQPGQFDMYTYRIVGDTLWSANLMSQNGPAAAPQMGRYVRVGRRVANQVEGAWRHVEGRTANGTVTNNQPGYRLYVDGYYAVVRVNGTTPRPALPDASGTAAQLQAVYGPYAAQLGTYEISGQSIIERPLVTLDPQGMTNPAAFVNQSFRVRADTLWVTNTANQNGPIAGGGTTGKYIRVRAPAPPTN
jgi:hypothetical protein